MEHIKYLEYARELAMIQKRYDESLNIVNELLMEDASNVDTLRLKGNILDLKLLDMVQYGEVDIDSHYCEDSKLYYEKIISIDPQNTLACIDLGDYWKRTGDYKQALKFYDKAIDILLTNQYYLSYIDECEEAFYGKADLLIEIGEIDNSLKCISDGLKLCPESKLLADLKDNAEKN